MRRILLLLVVACGLSACNEEKSAEVEEIVQGAGKTDAQLELDQKPEKAPVAKRQSVLQMLRSRSNQLK